MSLFEFEILYTWAATFPQLLIETENYSEWSRSMKTSLLVKNKIGFIDGTFTREKYEGDAFHTYQWERCNAIVQSWIMSSVVQELRKSIVYSSNAHKVWAAFKDRFDKVHTRETCYKLVGYPPGFKFTNKKKGVYEGSTVVAHNVHVKEELQKVGTMNPLNTQTGNAGPTNAVPVAPVFTPEQYQHILMMLNKGKEPEAIEMANMAGTSNHMASSLELLSNPLPVSSYSTTSVHFPNRDSTNITHTGSCPISNSQTLHNDLFSGMVKGIGRLQGELYILNPFTADVIPASTCLSSSIKTHSTTLWLQRLGHAPSIVLQKIPTIKNHLSTSNNCDCPICPLAKQIRLPFSISTTKCTNIFDLVYMDVWGPYRVCTYNGFRYFLTLVDDDLRMTWTFLLRLKSDVFVVLNDFIQLVQNQFSTTIKTFRSDNGHEFFNDLCSSTYIINGLPSVILKGKSPYELFHGSTPTLSHMRTIGCLCYATKTNYCDKFSPKSSPAIFMGYSSTQKGYRLLDIEFGKFFVNRDVVFKEHIFPFKHPKSQFLSSTNSTLNSPSMSFPTLSTPDSFSKTFIDSPSAPEPLINPELTSLMDLASTSLNHSSPSSTPSHLPPNTTTSIPSPEPIPDPPRRSGRPLKLSIWLTDYAHPPLPSTSFAYPIQQFVSYSHLPAHF
ncbi:uncharacterized protein LOC142167055 [Nicotiana tabacum]|uniref:Uncharacterized protein LOC142167055 n=1 Tax=Nicotiana tabacum TaxID=4097 RepID=A0AC58SEB3_TOBAC